ncbi:pancreatic triacylglycerol lipase-like [Palaemon carinicauda]|uniref:pancreatic triacylglycerol lipase-like n=1 Tax=Palaemon carinicauda TaxID=392227 RepID=UPI0035B665C2
MESVVLHALLSLSFTGRRPALPTVPPGEVCYDPFGCFTLEAPWAGTLERPVGIMPMPLNVTTPIFCLYTPSEPYCQELSLQNIGDLYTFGLDPRAPVYAMTHGYLETASLKWMVKMREALLKVSTNVSVITVDWSTAAHPPYTQSVSNIRVSGAVTGYLLHLLVKFYDVPASNIHLIGHSLGAHFMGYAGSFLSMATGQKVGRITGLDPAGPYFVNTPPEVRLDPSDADFVDVIHTDIPKESWEISKLGLPDPVGHLDYYPNGGFKQAGCITSAHIRAEEKKSLSHGVFSYIGCNHQRSHTFFTESILSKCQFLGVPCDSWEQFIQGSCWTCPNGLCPSMGFHAKPLDQNGETSSNQNDNLATDSQNSSVKVYLGTNSRSPFCAEQYRVTVVTSDTLESRVSGGDVARFTLKLRGRLGEHILPPAEKPTFIEPGGSLTWVGFSSHLGPLNALQVDYEEDQGLLHALIFRFSQPALYIESFTVDELSTGATTTFKFCGSRMQAGESHVLFANAQCPERSETTEAV